MQPFRCRQGSACVAVAVAGGDIQFDFFAHHAENNRVFARVVAHAYGVITDLITSTFTRVAFAAVNVFGVARQFVCDQFAKLERRSARRVGFEPMVAFDDFDIQPTGDIS